MNRFSYAAVLIAVLGSASFAWPANPGRCRHCEIRCPRCKCCVSEVEVVKVTKPCWEVECEPVCIPQVTFPWELPDCKLGCGWFCCPPAKCGKVRMVHVLKPSEYECQECRYKFTPVCCKCGRHIDGEAAEREKPAAAEELPAPPEPQPPSTTRRRPVLDLLPRLR